MCNILFDLDGTLIDYKLRIYKLFIDLTGISLSYKSFLMYRFNNYSNVRILQKFGYNEAQLLEFSINWLKLIEREQYLDYDTLFPFTSQTLDYLKNKNYNLWIVTNRQTCESTLKQLHKFEIINFFEDIFITEQKMSKKELISTSSIILDSSNMLIGDTCNDIEDGKKLNLKTIAVTSGFSKKKAFNCVNPDFIEKNISCLQKLF